MQSTQPGRRRRTPVFGRRFARHLVRLIGIYWRSPDAKWGGLLLALAVALELATVYGNLWLADMERRVFDALQDKDPGSFFTAIGLLLGVTLGFLLVSTYRIYVRQAVEIRWRKGVTSHFIDRWVGPRAYAQAELHGGEVDNPDQRIQEDTRDFVASALGLSLSLLSAVVTLASFGGLLWSLSRGWVVPLFGHELRIPGLLLWVAVGYALLSTVVTHFVGRRLVAINFDRLHFEADFRYGLVRFRDHVEAVALSRGFDVEQRGSERRFRAVIDNWWQLIQAQLELALTTMGFGQINGLVPILVAAPAFFAGLISLGVIVQIRFAYGQVSGALTWFVNAYQEIARWRANIERLSVFADVMDATEREVASTPLSVVPTSDPALGLDDVRLEDPDGQLLLSGVNARVAPGEHVAVVGPSGTCKTLLMRAIAGIWPFGSGRIEIPEHARMLFASEEPYMPIGTLRAVLSYPNEEGSFGDAQIREALGLLGLGRLAGRLDDTEDWDQYLSPLDQQRLGLARVLLQKPDWVFLDKATSALDEALEKSVYELLAERLPHATVISTAHRPALVDYHTRRWTLGRCDEGHVEFQAA
jgi:vitamin B12/bleomycin/antimicrobial peptide transport system ATP-binding/permease protein